MSGHQFIPGQPGCVFCDLTLNQASHFPCDERNKGKTPAEVQASVVAVAHGGKTDCPHTHTFPRHIYRDGSFQCGACPARVYPVKNGLAAVLPRTAPPPAPKVEHYFQPGALRCDLCGLLQGDAEELECMPTPRVRELALAAQAPAAAPEPLSPFDRIGADRLADEVDLLVRRKMLNERSPAADALLDYRSPPMSPRSDRLLVMEDGMRDIRRRLERMAPGSNDTIRYAIADISRLLGELPTRCPCGSRIVTSQGDRANCEHCGSTLCERCCDTRESKR